MVQFLHYCLGCSVITENCASVFCLSNTRDLVRCFAGLSNRQYGSNQTCDMSSPKSMTDSGNVKQR